MSDLLLWLDVETTGLDPENDKLLEVAAILTRYEPELPIEGEPFHAVIEPYPEGLGVVHPTVLDMHSRSGLWRAQSEEGDEPVLVSGAFRAWLEGQGIYRTAGLTIMLAGRSVHFDRQWLWQFNALDPHDSWIDGLKLSHRHFDLTAIKLFMALRGVAFEEAPDVHRALPDVQADIELARRLIEWTTSSA